MWNVAFVLTKIWQIDAAINSGNSGGPALQDDKVIGIAFETLDNAENIGYIIPVSRLNCANCLLDLREKCGLEGWAQN